MQLEDNHDNRPLVDRLYDKQVRRSLPPVSFCNILPLPSPCVFL